MDSSRSVNEEDFDRQKEFIIGIVKHFHVSVDEVTKLSRLFRHILGTFVREFMSVTRNSLFYHNDILSHF